MGAVVPDPARARGPAAPGRRLHERRDLAAALHQSEDHQEPFGRDLSKARRHQSHTRLGARRGHGSRHNRITTAWWIWSYEPMDLRMRCTDNIDGTPAGT